MSDAKDGLLREGLAQLAGAGHTSRYLEYCRPLEGYFALYRRWLATRDPAAAADLEGLVKRQVCDCLAMSEDMFASNVLDIATGLGVPGLPMAITHPIGRFTLLDADPERAEFLAAARAALGLNNVTVVNQPAAAFRPATGFQEVVCREDRPINEVVRETLHLVDRNGGRWLFLKREASAAELKLPPGTGLTSAAPISFPYWQDYRHLARIDCAPLPAPPPPPLTVPRFVSKPSGAGNSIAEILAAGHELLDRIVAEMQRIGYWSASPPPLLERYERGELQTYLDAPSFELWLQCVFVPRAREALENDDLPQDSAVGTMAMRQYDYHSVVSEALPLLDLLHEFDALVEKRAAAKP